MDNKELSAKIATEIMGENLIPPIEYAQAEVGSSYTQSTGPVWHLHTGDEVPMPEGEKLKGHESDTGWANGWNKRYNRYVCTWLLKHRPDLQDEIQLKLAAVRLPHKDYAGDLNALREAIDAFCKKTGLEITMGTPGNGWWVQTKLLHWSKSSMKLTEDEEPARAACLAMLKEVR